MLSSVKDRGIKDNECMECTILFSQLTVNLRPDLPEVKTPRAKYRNLGYHWCLHKQRLCHTLNCLTGMKSLSFHYINL